MAQKVITVKEAFESFLPCLKQFQSKEISEKALRILFWLHHNEYNVAQYAIRRYLNGEDPFSKKGVKYNIVEKVKEVKEVKEKKKIKRYYKHILLTFTHIDDLEYKISERLYPVYLDLLDMYNNNNFSYKHLEKKDRTIYASLKKRYFSDLEKRDI